MKVCSKCKKLLPEQVFYKDMQKKDNLRYECKSCNNETRQQYHNKNKIKDILRMRQYRATQNGKIAGNKHTAKRQRNLGWEIITDNPFDEPVEWHHINDNQVIALPKDLHHLYLGVYHRENLVYIIKQLYEE